MLDIATQFEEYYTKNSQADPLPESEDIYIVLNDQVEILRLVTREYSCVIGYIPIIKELSQRKSKNKLKPAIETHSYIPSADDLIQFVLQDIEVTFDQIPGTPR